MKRKTMPWSRSSRTMVAAGVALISVMCSGAARSAQPVDLTVHTDQPGAKISPHLWGIFFEDINLGADGGLYAELIKNRGFEFPDAMMGWFKISPSLAKGDVTVRDQDPFDAANPHYLRLRTEGTAPFGVSNVGFRGIGLKEGDPYDFSARIRVIEGNPRITVELVGGDGTTLATTRLRGMTSDWREIKASLIPNDTDPKCRLNVMLDGRGTVDLDFVSLFPRKTWKNRPGGLRADMVQALADLQPGFLRFPGGCIVEGSVLARRYQWEKTIGPVEERQLLINRWNYEFKHRPTPDYYQSFGLGFFEFFQLSEDIGAEPLPILGCGMACQFNSGELAPMDQLDSYIQEALDLIEFANGPADSPWGAKRAAMGHPEPFHMKMLGIGNEQWGPQYIERYAAFQRVLRDKHPEIKLVSAAGPSPQDQRFHYLWPELKKLHADIVDEHCYANPIWFFSNDHRYDSYDPAGPKVFFGEYAAQSVAIVSTKNRNNLECALSEAAFLTGVERNADVVTMASYAPLFAHVDGWQWTPDLIWVDNLRVLRTANYYVQQLYSRNRGDVVLPVDSDAPVNHVQPTGRIGLGTHQSSAEFKDVRVTRGAETLLASDFASGTDGWSGGDRWQVRDGAFRQPDPNGSSTVRAGDTDWTDYTLTLKARKLSGSEGFVITVYDDDNGAQAQWNLGGWGNTQHAIQTHYAQQDQLVDTVPGTIESGRWYDIKVVLNGTRMACYLDGQLVQSAEILPRQIRRVYASAVRDNQTGEVILKLVNPGEASTTANIDLVGVSGVNDEAKATVLTGGDVSDVNTFDQPRKVAPVESVLRLTGPRFHYELKPRSFTVLRVKTM